jgi:transcriptional regulator with XRE-family HTH domain
MQKKKPGILIREARNSLRLTQRDLAALVGVEASHIAYIEGGQRNPSLALLRRLADTLGLNRRELLFLVHPDARQLTEDQTHPSSASRPDGWRRFASNRALLQRHRITPAELRVLRQVDRLGPVGDPRNFLFILNSIRMAASADM